MLRKILQISCDLKGGWRHGKGRQKEKQPHLDYAINSSTR